MKDNFRETIEQRTDEELPRMANDIVLYSPEERFVALCELERRGLLTEKQAASKKALEEEFVPMPDSVSILPVYRRGAVWLALLIGGPWVVAYMVAENFKVFNRPRRVVHTWIYTSLFTILYLCLCFLIPYNVWTHYVHFPFMTLYAIAVVTLVNKFQGRGIDAHYIAGGRMFSWGRAILVCLIGFVITFVGLFCIAFPIVLIAEMSY